MRKNVGTVSEFGLVVCEVVDTLGSVDDFSMYVEHEDLLARYLLGICKTCIR